MSRFLDFTDPGTPASASDYLVGYATGGGAGSDRRWTLTNLILRLAQMSWTGKLFNAGAAINWNSGALTLTEVSGGFTFATATDAAPMRMSNTNAGANGVIFDLFADSASPANADVLGSLRWLGRNNAAALKTYAQILVPIADVASGSEDASLDSYLIKAGTLTKLMSLDAANFQLLGGTGLRSDSKLSTAGIGYATGAGDAVSQGTSKATTVTCNGYTGSITMFIGATLNAATIVSFTVNNSAIANTTEQVLVSHVSGGTLGAYTFNARVTGSGTMAIDCRNNTAGNLTEAMVVRFIVLKSVNA